MTAQCCADHSLFIWLLAAPTVGAADERMTKITAISLLQDVFDGLMQQVHSAQNAAARLITAARCRDQIVARAAAAATSSCPPTNDLQTGVPGAPVVLWSHTELLSEGDCSQLRSSATLPAEQASFHAHETVTLTEVFYRASA